MRDQAPTLPFPDRSVAGQLLAERLSDLRGEDVLVLGIPRGGVEVAAGIARTLGAELDVIVARKLGAPFHPELAIGAVTADGTRFIIDRIVAQVGATGEYLADVTETEHIEAQRRQERFRAGLPPLRIAGRTVVIVDDGLATGATMFAAVHAVRAQRPARLIAAVPVAARESAAMLAPRVDELVTLAQPDPFNAVGLFYRQFPQLDDEEVEILLEENRRARPDRVPMP